MPKRKKNPKPGLVKRTRTDEQGQHETEQMLQESSSSEPSSPIPNSPDSGQSTLLGEDTTDFLPNTPGPSSFFGPNTSFESGISSVTDVFLEPNVSGSCSSSGLNVLSKLAKTFSEPTVASWFKDIQPQIPQPSRPHSSEPGSSGPSTSESSQPSCPPGPNTSETDTTSPGPSTSSAGSETPRGSVQSQVDQDSDHTSSVQGDLTFVHGSQKIIQGNVYNIQTLIIQSNTPDPEPSKFKAEDKEIELEISRAGYSEPGNSKAGDPDPESDDSRTEDSEPELDNSKSAESGPSRSKDSEPGNSESEPPNSKPAARGNYSKTAELENGTSRATDQEPGTSNAKYLDPGTRGTSTDPGSSTTEPDPGSSRTTYPEPCTSRARADPEEPSSSRGTDTGAATPKAVGPERGSIRATDPEPGISIAGVPEPSTSRVRVDPEPSTSRPTDTEPGTPRADDSEQSTSRVRVDPAPSTSRPTDTEPGTPRADDSEQSTSRATDPNPGTSRAAYPERGSSRAANPDPGNSRTADPELGTSRATDLESGNTRAADTELGTSRATDLEPGNSRAADAVSANSRIDPEPTSDISRETDQAPGTLRSTEPEAGTSRAGSRAVDSEPGNSRTAEATSAYLSEVSVKDIRDVAKNAKLSHDDLKDLFVELDIEETDIERAARSTNSSDFQIQSYHVLRWWRQSNGRSATRKKIIDALEECVLIEAKEILEEKWDRTYQDHPASEEDIVEDIRDDLKDFYIQRLCKKQMYPWKPGKNVDLNDIHVPLTIDIKIPGARGQHVKKPLRPYTEFLAQDQKDVRYILSGDPGQGKSTFCAKLAYDWSEEVESAGLSHIQLLFILELGKVDRSSNIEDAIYSQLLSTDYNLTPAILRKVLYKLGKSIAIVLDGLDEAPTDLLHENNPQDIGSVVKILQYKERRKWKVLVTTRPWRESEILHDHAEFKRLELRKLTKADGLKLVGKFFNTPHDPIAIALGERLKKDIKHNKHLVDTSTPLAILLLCWYWAESDGKKGIPKRRHQLYMAIFKIMSKMQQRPSSKLKDLIDHLGEVSLQGLTPTSTKILFTEEEVLKCCTKEEIADAMKMGILGYMKEKNTCIFSTSQDKSFVVENILPMKTIKKGCQSI